MNDYYADLWAAQDLARNTRLVEMHNNGTCDGGMGETPECPGCLAVLDARAKKAILDDVTRRNARLSGRA